MGEEIVRKKRAREDSVELDPDQCESKRVHRPSPHEFTDCVVEDLRINNNGIPEDILDGLDDDGDTMPENQYLDSVIRSFEEEILQSSPSPSTRSPPPPPPPPEITNLRSDSGEYQLDLGYLLEASDDELGLPPTDSEPPQQQPPNQDPIDLLRMKSSDSADLGDMFAFDNEVVPKYSDFEFDEMAAGGGVVDNSDGGFVAAGGLFEYSEPADPSADLSWLCGCT